MKPSRDEIAAAIRAADIGGPGSTVDHEEAAENVLDLLSQAGGSEEAALDRKGGGITADTEDFGEPTVPACDLLRLAHSALGAPGVLDWLAGEGLVFCRSEGEYPSGKSWRFFADDHAPDLAASPVEETP